MLFSSRVSIRIRFSVWLVSGFVHVFILIFVITVKRVQGVENTGRPFTNNFMIFANLSRVFRQIRFFWKSHPCHLDGWSRAVSGRRTFIFHCHDSTRRARQAVSSRKCQTPILHPGDGLSVRPSLRWSLTQNTLVIWAASNACLNRGSIPLRLAANNKSILKSSTALQRAVLHKMRSSLNGFAQSYWT